MLKIIFKNLWHRRRANGWLFVELILVSILLWFIMGQVVSLTYPTSQPVGYDADRLILFSFESYPPDSEKYSSESDSAQAMHKDIERIFNKIKLRKEYESATIAVACDYINSSTVTISGFHTGNPGVDSVRKGTFVLNFVSGTDFFETYGIKQLVKNSDRSLSETGKDVGIIITKEIADSYWPGEKSFGKGVIKEVTEQGDTVWTPVVGVVSDTRYRSYFNTYSIVFYPYELNEDDKIEEFEVIARIRPGVKGIDAAYDAFQWGVKELNDGNYYLANVKDYGTIIDAQEAHSVGTPVAIFKILAAFFLISLVLGTIGTMSLQVRRRYRETGVLRSFGASKSQIVTMLLGESAVLVTVAFLIADLLYFQWAHKYGFYQGFGSVSYNMSDNWITNFGVHFIIISVISYLIILLTVIIGTLLPALSLSRVNPVEALRNE